LVEQGGNGALHAPDDAAGMGESLRVLLSDKKALLRARQRSRELAYGFDLKKVVSAYEKLLREAASR
jgi:hypothetical protein